MSFSVERKEQYAIISYDGSEKLDSVISPELKSQCVLLNAEGVRNIVLDLTPFRYCDSSGLSAILVANRLCTNSNGLVVICGVQPMVMKLIEISQLDSILVITPSLDEAEQYVKMEVIEREANGSE